MTTDRDPIQVLTDNIFHELTRFPSRERIDGLVREYRKTVLKEAVDAIDRELDGRADSFAEAHDRSYDRSVLSALQNQCGGLRDAKTAVEELTNA